MVREIPYGFTQQANEVFLIGQLIL